MYWYISWGVLPTKNSPNSAGHCLWLGSSPCSGFHPLSTLPSWWEERISQNLLAATKYIPSSLSFKGFYGMFGIVHGVYTSCEGSMETASIWEMWILISHCISLSTPHLWEWRSESESKGKALFSFGGEYSVRNLKQWTFVPAGCLLLHPWDCWCSLFQN